MPLPSLAPCSRESSRRRSLKQITQSRLDSGTVRSLRGPPHPPLEPRRDCRSQKGTTARGGHVAGVVGVDSKSSAPAPSVRARRDRESPRALQYGRGSVTRIMAPMVVVGLGP